MSGVISMDLARVFKKRAECLLEIIGYLHVIHTHDRLC